MKTRYRKKQSDQRFQKVESQVQIPLKDSQQKVIYMGKVKCVNGKQCIHLCAEQNCQKNAAICADTKCSCWEDHRNGTICSKVPFKDILELTKVKIQKFRELEQYIENALEILIDWIRNEWQKVRESIKLIGRNNDQQKFLKTLKNGEVSELKGQLVSKIFQDLKQQQEQQNDKIRAVNIKNQVLSQIECQMEKIKKQVCLINEVIDDCSMKKSVFEDFKSKVVVTMNQKATVTRMIDSGKRKVWKYELLYRASENDFAVEKFWEKCNHKADTVTLIHTEYDKVIGGYTPISWKKENHASYVQDSSLLSFVFSVTEKTKFRLKDSLKQHAIVHNTDFGPIFGGGWDMAVYNNAKNNSSYANIGYSYENSKLQHKAKEGWQFFQGSTENSNFKIKEWEVWQVVFE